MKISLKNKLHFLLIPMLFLTLCLSLVAMMMMRPLNYQNQPLQDDDIIHELLHVRFPDWSEEKVNYWTTLIISQSDTNIRSLKIV